MVSEARGVGVVSGGEAGGTVPQAPRVPNGVLRWIRKGERGESQREFAEAMARAGWEMGFEVYPDGNYVQRLGITEFGSDALEAVQRREFLAEVAASAGLGVAGKSVCTGNWDVHRRTFAGVPQRPSQPRRPSGFTA
jgi:hypothetical protein